jgi:hypothetical protein
MKPGEIQDLLDAIEQPKLDLSKTKGGRKIRDELIRENERWGGKFVIP